MMEKKLNLSGKPLRLGGIDPTTLKASKRNVEVNVRTMRAPSAPVSTARKLDTSAAFEAQDMIAGITTADIAWGRMIARSTRGDNLSSYLRRRTEVMGMIPNLILINGSSELSREMSAEMHDPNRDITDWEKTIYRAAFPDYDEPHATTLCTPLGAKLIMNWLAIFGTKPYVNGTTNLEKLTQYATLSDFWMEQGYATPDMPEEPEPESDRIAKMVLRTEGTDRNKFKNRLLYDQRFMVICPLTKVTDTRFLIASHIKPFAACEHRGERVDADNGFLLSPSADKLFDHGYISFTDEGVMMRSAKLGINGALLKSLGIDPNARVPIKSERTKEYLAYHRNVVFEGARTREKSQ